MSLCAVESCTERPRCKGYCGPHYRRFARYGDPTEGRRGRDEIVFRDELGRKQCMCCGEWLHEDRFQQVLNSSTDGLYTRCKRCLTDGKRGLSITQRRKLLEIQGGACLCGKEFEPHGGRQFTYFIDHDHSCCPGHRSCGECIRGLLCNACNIVLGHVGDDPDVLSKLIDYLACPSAS